MDWAQKSNIIVVELAAVTSRMLDMGARAGHADEGKKASRYTIYSNSSVVVHVILTWHGTINDFDGALVCGTWMYKPACDWE